jgi:electron transport complex protein RnfD
MVVGLIGKVAWKDMFKHVLNSYSYVTGIIFALCLPANTSLFTVIIGAVFGTALGKLVFGGFGHNVVNPAGIGRIMVGLTFTLGSTILPGAHPDFIGGSTITGKIDWLTGFIPPNYTLLDLFLGQYIGAIGETSTLVLLIAAGILICRGIINYRVFGAYVGTSFVIALVLGLVFGVDFVLTYALTHMFAGGLMFGAVFMITDPVTSPTSSLGKIIFAIGAAMLTMLIRVCGGLPEGVVFSIVIMNFMVPLIDGAIKGRTTDKQWKSWVTVAVALVIAVLVNVGFALL